MRRNLSGGRLSRYDPRMRRDPGVHPGVPLGAEVHTDTSGYRQSAGYEYGARHPAHAVIPGGYRRDTYHDHDDHHHHHDHDDDHHHHDHHPHPDHHNHDDAQHHHN